MNKDIRYVIRIGKSEAYLCKNIYPVNNGWKPSLNTCILNITSNDFKKGSVASYKTKQAAEKKIIDTCYIIKNEISGLDCKAQLLRLIKKAYIVVKDFTRTNNIEFVKHYKPICHSKAKTSISHCSSCGIVLKNIPYVAVKANSFGTANICYSCLCIQKGNLESYWNALPKERQEEINGEIFLNKLKSN